MSDGFEPESTTVEGWKAAALKWKAEADALRAENERLARTAHTLLGALKVSSPRPHHHTQLPRGCLRAHSCSPCVL